ncbi:MAG: ATP-binding protein, partial [bacterium]
MALEETYYAYNPWWEGKKFDSGIPRHGYLAEIDKTFSRKQIDIIIGSRRVGKTTFLKQLIKTSIERNVPAKNILYLALDNPKFVTVPISEHLRLFRTIFMHSRDEKLYLFLDEVHESPNWEAEIKAIYDLENLKIVCTG